MTHFNKTPTVGYRKAVQSLQNLLKEHDLDMVRRAYAEAVHQEWKAFFIRDNGLSPCNPMRICLHWLKRKRCPAEDGLCPLAIPGTDHVSAWERPDGTRLIISQPYEFSDVTLKETATICKNHGIKVRISSEPSWHFPGAVVTVEYENA